MFQKAHSAVSHLLNEAFARWSLQDFDKDVLWAMLMGIVLGLVILAILAAFPGGSGEPLDHVNEKVLEREKNQPAEAVVSTASDKENEQNLHGTKYSRHQTMENDSISMLSILNILVYLLLFSGFVYFLNRDYENVATKWFVRTFPREAETLGLHSEL